MKHLFNSYQKICLIDLVKVSIIVALSCLFVISVQKCTEPDPVLTETMVVPESDNQEMTIADSVYSCIFLMRLEHPPIVMAQCIEESGNFNSPLFVDGHNCTGMRVPAQRATLARSVLYGHARFDSWKDCIADYAIWQSTYARGLTEDEYFAYLDRVYAEKKGYSDRLKKIIETRGL